MCPHDPSFTHIDCVYSCSHWSKDKEDPRIVISRFIQQIDQSYNEISGIVHKSIKYGEGDKRVIEVWGDECTCDSLLIWIHGGYWQEGSPVCASLLVRSLNKNGIIVASIGYEYAEEGRPITAITLDVSIAIKTILSIFTKVGRIVVGGHSAGAQLAYQASLLITYPLITGLALFSGIYDLSELIGTVIGIPIGLTQQDAIVSSCNGNEWNEGDVDILLFNGEYDSPSLRTMTGGMYERLRKNGMKTKWREVEGEDHFSLIQGLNQEDKQQTRLLIQFCCTQAL